MKNFLFLALSIFLLAGCNKHYEGSGPFKSRYGLMYKSVDSEESYVVVFKKKKAIIYREGVRNKIHRPKQFNKQYMNDTPYTTINGEKCYADSPLYYSVDILEHTYLFVKDAKEGNQRILLKRV